VLPPGQAANPALNRSSCQYARPPSGYDSRRLSFLMRIDVMPIPQN
jgi:hypothetical protein